MSIGEKAPAPPPAHRIVLADRQRLTVSGVEGVESFDEATIVLTTSEGSLIVRGEGLHIEKLSLDGGDLLVEGTVESLTYEEEEPRQSLFGRLFRG
jgi:sporulation protein YabP